MPLAIPRPTGLPGQIDKFDVAGPLGAEWIKYGPTTPNWQVASGVLKELTGGLQMEALKDFGALDVVVTCDLTVASNTGLIVRSGGSSGGILIAWGSTQSYIYSRLYNNVYGLVANLGAQGNTGKLKAVCQGQSLLVYINDKLIYSDATILSTLNTSAHTHYGNYAYADATSTRDNFSVRPILSPRELIVRRAAIVNPRLPLSTFR